MTTDVLAVAAHPDDVEFGCGGTLLLAADAGLQVVIVDLTAGELSTRGDPATRERERRRATELLGLTGRECVGLPDGRVGSEPEHRDAVAAVIRRLRPRVVLAPHTEDRHPDHAAAGCLVRDACFFAGVAKAGPGPPHRPRRLYHYMLHQPFEPVFVVDVSAVWDRRLQVATVYASQVGNEAGEPVTALSGGRFLDVLAGRATFYGARSGPNAASPSTAAGRSRWTACRSSSRSSRRHAGIGRRSRGARARRRCRGDLAPHIRGRALSCQYLYDIGNEGLREPSEAGLQRLPRCVPADEHRLRRVPHLSPSRDT